MVPLDTCLFVFVVIFALVGALRGWAREMLVLFAVILALAVRLIFTEYVPIAREFLDRPPEEQFYIYTSLIILMTLGGYAGPAISGRLAGVSAREKLQDVLLGMIIGAVNGFLIVGSIWYFLDAAGYGVMGIEPPPPDSLAAVFATTYLPPIWLADAILLTVFSVASVFVIIVLV